MTELVVQSFRCHCEERSDAAILGKYRFELYLPARGKLIASPTNSIGSAVRGEVYGNLYAWGIPQVLSARMAPVLQCNGLLLNWLVKTVYLRYHKEKGGKGLWIW